MDKSNDVSNKIQDIAEISNLMKLYRKKTGLPLVIEISGTPNSGKSSVISKIQKMLSRNRISHSVIYEAAQKCKIQDKLSEDYNIWTACNMLCSLIEKSNTNKEVIICERGVFDALCWCDFHYRRNNLTIEEKKLFDKVLTSPRFIDLISILFVFRCSPEASIAREDSLLTYHTQGRIVNTSVIKEINESIDHVKSHYLSFFKLNDEIDTSTCSQLDLEYSFSQKLQNKLVKINGNISDTN